MNFIMVCLLLTSAAPYQKQFDRAMDLFSSNYSNRIFKVEKTCSNGFPIGGPASVFSRPLREKDILVTGRNAFCQRNLFHTNGHLHNQ